LQPDITESGQFRLFGAPVIVTARIPFVTTTTKAILADFSQIAVARDLAPSVTILKERYAEFDQQAVRVVTRFDAAPLNPQAIVRLDGITYP
jgi:HK97 family phage major capsid protein